MSLKCGIVGLPNVGKSTLFNALTKAGIAAENYPFCTIEPNVGIVEVPDPRLAKLAADRQAAEGHPGHRRVRRHRRPGRRRVEGRRASATSSSPTSARPTPSSTWCAASSTRTWCTSPARSIRSPTSRPSTPSWRWPIWPRWKSSSRSTRKSPRPAATRKRNVWSRCWRRCRPRSTRASRRARSICTPKRRTC